MTSFKNDSCFRTDPLRDHVFSECKAMAQYALASGLKVPPGLLAALDGLLERESHRRAPPADGDGTDGGTAAGTPAARKPAGDMDSGTRKLAAIHSRLVDLVAPATPRSLLLLANENARGGFWLFLGPVPLIRRLMLVAFFSLVALIAISLSSEVNGDTKNFSLLENDGLSLLLNQLFLLTAASLGATFANLFQANRFIKDNTFDPKFESSFWIRYVLGLMSGMILALLIPIETMFASGEGGASGGALLQGLGKPSLAMLGGFSAAVVYRILNKVINAIDSLVRGDVREEVAAHEQAAKARLAEQEVRHRVGLAGQLNKLRQQLGAGGDPERLKLELDRIQQSLFSEGFVEDVEAPGSAAGEDGR